jgi:hypothetical protein
MLTTRCINKPCKGTMLMFMYTRSNSCASMWVCPKCGTDIFISEKDSWKLVIDKLPIKNNIEGKTNE